MLHGSKSSENRSILPMIKDSMSAYKDRTALCFLDKTYTYEELDRMSLRIATFLKSRGVKKGDVISVLVPRCEYMTITALGILRAGAAYQPLDASHPADRIRFMIEDADAPVVIVSKKLAHLTETSGDAKKERIFLYMEDIPYLPVPQNDIWENTGKDDPFIILYTSGTTGVPKGMILTHGNIFSACRWHLKFYEVDEECRMGQHPSFVFDLAIVELLFPLTAGASIHIIPEDIRTDLNKLNAFLEENGITHLTMTTQLGRQFAMTVKNSSLRHLTVGGEALISVAPPSGYKLHNDYGPAECSLYTTVFTIDREYTGKVPIGRAVDEVRLYVVDGNGQLVDDGKIGELCIAGPHVALGYLNRPELTEAAFTGNPFSDDPEYGRMYHSGDLVIRQADGVFEFMGRADRQVKIRGIRIEPAEIEELLRKYDGIDDVVIATPEAGGQRVIAAYYMSEHELDVRELEKYVLKYKPSYMCPSFFIRIDKIPLNTNGKVDHRRLPQPDFDLNREVYEEPVNETERVLAMVYGELLKMDRIGRKDDFMRIGGNSLLIAQLQYQIEKMLSCAVTAREIMETSVLSKLADLIDEKKKEGSGVGFKTVPDKALPMRDDYHVSRAQERIYTAQKLLNKGDPTYLLTVAIKTEGVISSGRTKDVLAVLFKRHESLRTGFDIRGAEIVQMIHPADDDWVRTVVERAYTKDGPDVYRLEEAPLFRWSIKDNELIFYWHHIINDGTGTALFAREFVALYNGEDTGLETIHQKEYAEWEYTWRTTDDHVRCMEGWKEQIAGCTDPEGLRLPYDGIKEEGSRKKAGHIRLSLDCKRSSEIKERCSLIGVTPYMFFVSVFSILLYRYSGKDRFLLGTAVDGRGQHTSGLQGMFANTLPIPVHINEEYDLAGFIETIRDRVLFMLDNRQAALEDIAKVYEELGGTGRTAHGHLLFDVFFVMRDFDSAIDDMDGHPASLFWPYDEMPMYDLTLEAGMEDGAYSFVFEYDRDLFFDESIGFMSRHYDMLLNECIKEDPGMIGGISMIDDKEKDILLASLNTREQVFNTETVIQRLAGQAEMNPDKTALIFGESHMTYKELFDASGIIARRLRTIYEKNSGDKADSERWVALIAGRGFGMIASIFGILRSGAGYIPISPEYPVERMNYMLKEAGVECVIICDAAVDAGIFETHGPDGLSVIEISTQKLLNGINMQSGERIILPEVLPEQNAYMIFTSGSTGEPKGVVVEHEQLSALLDAYTGIYELDGNDTVLQFANYVFDQSVWDIFHILSVGGTLCLIPDSIVRDPERLAEYCEAHKVTVASLTPGFLRLMDPSKLKSLRLLDVGGEAPENSLLKAWSTGRTVFNTYGPTETTVNATSFMYAKNGRILYEPGEFKENVPIGRAVPGTRVYILRGDRLCPVGVPGELCIAGAQVTRGYKNRPALTDEKYVKDPFGNGRMYRSGDLARVLPDGNIEFISRMDDQVKIRGYRIEPGETEAVLRSLDGVSDAAVIIFEDENGERQLCGYYIPKDKDGRDDGVKAVRAQLEKCLPIYMVPSVLIPVNEFKLTVNGKTDRHSLPDPGSYNVKTQKAGERILPSTEEERDCLEAFREVLGTGDIGIDDDFFELGGDSIKAIRIVSLLRKKGYGLDAAGILKSRNIRRISAGMKKTQQADHREYEEVIPTPVMKMFENAYMKNPSHYDQSVLFKIQGDVSEAALKWALNGLVYHHGMLRMILNKDGSIRIREVSETEDIGLPVYKDPDDKERVKIMDDLNASMDPEKGRIMRAALFRSGEGDRLFLSFHHYVIDEVSWGIISEDLNTLYKSALKTDGIRNGYERINEILPVRTVSFGEWSKVLSEYPGTPDFKPEKEYWERVHADIISHRQENESLLEYFMQGETVGKKGSGIITADIGKDISDRLIKISTGRYRMRPDALFAAVLVKTLHKINGAGSVMMQMESHGRGDTGKGLPVDRTVGWFTTVYPILFPVSEDMDEQIVNVKEEMAAVLNFGIGYGLLYDDLITMGGLVFNYLGSDRVTKADPIGYTDEYAGEESDSENADPKTISVNIRSYDTGSRIECVYDLIYSKDRIGEFIDDYIKALEHLADEIWEEGTVISPSDLCVTRLMSMEEWGRLTAVVRPEDIAAIGVATPLQQGMLYRLATQPDTGAYLLQDRLVLKGRWRKDDFVSALRLAFARFDVLRIRFAIKGFDELWQIILKENAIEPEYLEISGKSMEEIADDDLKRGFDPEKGVMLRVTLNADDTDNDKAEMLLSSHHSIIDGWSFRILTDTIVRYYRRLGSGESYEKLYPDVMNEASADMSYPDYLKITGKRDRETSLLRWDEYLDGINEGAGLLQPRENENGGPADHAFLNVTGDKEEQIRRYTKEKGITSSTFFGTLWGILLGFENDMNDVVFGETVSGRNIDTEGIENAVGMFINTIPVRIKWDKDSYVSDLMKHRQEDYIRMQSYEDVPLHKIIKRRKTGSSLVRSLYVYENYPAGTDDESCIIRTIHEEVDYPLSVSIEEQEGFLVDIQYDSVRYEHSYIRMLLDRYDNLIRQIVSGEDLRVCELERISAAERRVMLSDISGESREFPNVTFLDLLYDKVRDNKEKCAVIMDGHALTYGQLWTICSRLADMIGQGGERFIAIYTDRSIELLVSLIASFMAGAAYVPLDPDYPDERIEFILSDCSPVAVLRHINDRSDGRTQLFENAGIRVLDVCAGELLLQKDSSVMIEPPFNDMAGSLAYMIYTSGTTGVPKGVEIEHAALSEMIFSNMEFYDHKVDVVLQVANYVFDASVFEFFVTLASGGTVCMISKENMSSSDAMAQYCRDNKVNYIASTNALLQALVPEKFDTLGVVCAGGDAANADIFERWSKHSELMVNDYGPTEACVNAVAYKYVPGKTGTIPIGRPYLNKKVYIMQNDKLCGVGQKGEICIGGKGLARGYHDRDDLNEQAFVLNPYTKERMYRTGDMGYFNTDGEIYYLGRNDDQIKIRGFRIETGEIESRIREYENVREAVVVSRSDGGREAYLAAYITGEGEINTEMLRTYLMKKLPSYMVPVAITRLDVLPRTASDKIDVNELPVPVFTEDKAAPAGYLEEMTASLYEKILGIERVGRDDSFFDLGGSSLDMMRFVAELDGYDISIADVAAAPTPRLFGELLIKRMRGSDKKNNTVTVLKDGRADRPAIFCIPPSGGMSLCYLPLIRELGYDGRIYGITDDKYRIFAGMTIEELSKYELHRKEMWDDTVASFYEGIREIFSDGDILIGYSQGGPAAYLVARQLEDAGLKVGRLIMLESPEPGSYSGTEENRAERIAVSAAIFAGRNTADLNDERLFDETIPEMLYFTDYLKGNFGEDADERMLHSVMETYLVYSLNVLNPICIEGKIRAGIDSIVLCTQADLSPDEAVLLKDDPWRGYSGGRGSAYGIYAAEDDHLAFLSKYKKQISQIVKKSLMK